jgi:hypothetical protein
VRTTLPQNHETTKTVRTSRTGHPSQKIGLTPIIHSTEAVDGNRTRDLFLTKEVLYQLSYNSKLSD